MEKVVREAQRRREKESEGKRCLQLLDKIASLLSAISAALTPLSCLSLSNTLWKNPKKTKQRGKKKAPALYKHCIFTAQINHLPP